MHVQGHIGLPLAQAVPPVARRGGGSLPKALGSGQAGCLLASCDRRGAIGRRDYAMLLLALRLGLRAGEIVALALDIDWRAGEIMVRGKGRCRVRLALPADVGEALAGCLRQGRSPTECRMLFLRSVAPLRGLGAPAVSWVVYRACDRAGLPRVGARRLRHTAATGMLRAGAWLSYVGQVLRHRSAMTTAIYAKVDHGALGTLARPWPGSAA
ncbi:MAG: tyrosine-type recombinase/integrase [Egibacteraceae bacterium]